MTIHPARRKAHREQRSVSSDQTGTTKARRGDRIENKRLRANGGSPPTELGRRAMHGFRDAAHFPSGPHSLNVRQLQTAEPEMTATLTLSAGPTADHLSIIADANVSWMLADAANVCLRGHERTMTFVELGCGEDHLAIERILNAVKSNRMMLPVAIFDRLTRWLDGYVGSPEEPRLRRLVAEVRAQEFEPVPLQAQQAQCADVRRTVALAHSTGVAR
jgi:hypothetical protein